MNAEQIAEVVGEVLDGVLDEARKKYKKPRSKSKGNLPGPLIGYLVKKGVIGGAKGSKGLRRKGSQRKLKGIRRKVTNKMAARSSREGKAKTDQFMSAKRTKDTGEIEKRLKKWRAGKTQTKAGKLLSK